MSGKAAAFGGRMMSTVADQVLKQFADNFAARVGAMRSAGAAAVAARRPRGTAAPTPDRPPPRSPPPPRPS